jgi:hypothetical protein
MLPTTARSERLAVGPAGLTRYNPENGQRFAVTGLHAYAGTAFIHFTTDLFPMQDKFTADPFDAHRPWLTKPQAWLLAGAILGLFLGLYGMGHLIYSASASPFNAH